MSVRKIDSAVSRFDQLGRVSTHAKPAKGYGSALNIISVAEGTVPRGIRSVGNVMCDKYFEALDTG